MYINIEKGNFIYMFSNKLDILKDLSEKNAVKHADELINENELKLHAVCQDIDEYLIRAAKKGNDCSIMDRNTLTKLFTNNCIDTIGENEFSIFCKAIATLYSKEGINVKIDYDSFGDIDYLFISWDSRKPTRKDIDEIIKKQQLIDETHNFSTDLLEKYQIDNKQKLKTMDFSKHDSDFATSITNKTLADRTNIEFDTIELHNENINNPSDTDSKPNNSEDDELSLQTDLDLESILDSESPKIEFNNNNINAENTNLNSESKKELNLSDDSEPKSITAINDDTPLDRDMRSIDNDKLNASLSIESNILNNNVDNLESKNNSSANNQYVIDELNKIYDKFKQYFGTKYLNKDVKNGHYNIYLQIYENKSQKYLFTWDIKTNNDFEYYNQWIIDQLKTSVKFILEDKITNKKFEASPVFRDENKSEYKYSTYSISDKTMLPIIHGYMRSKKRLDLYEKANEIYDLASLKTMCLKYKMHNILWFNATAPNALYLRTYDNRNPQLKLIVNTSPASVTGMYFLSSFDWDRYHSDKYAKKKFYQYVWHEVVNFYYFKQDYYLYNKIFNFGHDLDFRKAFADYSVDCRLLATKANIMKDTSDQKNIDNPWYTSRTATYDSNYVQS